MKAFRLVIKYTLLKIIEVIEFFQYFRFGFDEVNEDIKIIDTQFVEKYLIETDNGFEPITNVHLTQPYTQYYLETQNGKYLEGADNHILFDLDMNQVFIRDLKLNDIIQTIDGPSRVTKRYKTAHKLAMGDLTVASADHRYYSNGILSHNTVTSAIYMLWFLLFHPEKTALVVADNFTTTKELIEKFKIGLDNLPFFMKPGIKHINSGNIKFDNDARIVARTTTKKSGIGLSVNLLYMDEFAHINEANLNDFYKAILPTITADPNAKVIITSTPNGKNKFYDIWSDAIAGLSEYVPLRVDWWQVAGRDEEWKQKVIANLGSVEDFNQEYGLQFFSSDQLLLKSTELKRLYNIKANYIATQLTHDEDWQFINDYLTLHPNYAKRTIQDFKLDQAQYVFSVDTADGVGGDFSVLNIYKVVALPIKELLKKKEAIRSELDTISLVQIGHFRSNEVEINQFAAAVEFITYKIFNPDNVRIVLEWNHKGELIHNRLVDNPNYWTSQIVHTKHTEMAVNVKPGLRLGPTNKIRYCEKFKYFISINKIIPTDYLTIMELMSFGKSKGGNYRGQNGNDDLAMTCVNLSPFFESSQYWDLATLTYEMAPAEYRKEVEEKIFSFFRSGEAKPLFDYDALRNMNQPSNGATDEKSVRRHVFDIESLEKMKEIQNRFFKS